MWTGVRFLPWIQRLALHNFRISPSRIPRAVFITLLSAAGELLAFMQWFIWGHGLKQSAIESDPVVIVGHWRSGTTLLHELLACDQHLCAPTTAQCACPTHFVLSEQFAHDWLGALLPRNRPMDQMPMGYQKPQEDELALCNLGMPSPWWVIAFPNEPIPDTDYKDLEHVAPSVRRQWVRAWTTFLRHVQFEHRGRLLLKNPLHSYRIPLIREVFPETHFIHIVRNPYELVPSCLHFWKKMFDQYGLQRATCEHLEDQVFASIIEMNQRLTDTWSQVSPAHRLRVRYEDLTQHPLNTLRHIYVHFQWQGIEDVLPKWKAYLQAHQHYQPNKYDVDQCLRERITTQLGPLLSEYEHSLSRPS